MPDAASKPRGVKPHRAIVASTCVALVILAGLLLWQPWANIDAAPMTDPEPGAADSGQLAGEGLTDLPDDQATHTTSREQVLTTAEEGKTETPDRQTGSLLLTVLYAPDNSPAAKIGVVTREATRHGPVPPYVPHRTDEHGKAHIDGLRPGSVLVLTDRQRFKYEKVEILAGKTTEATIVLKDGIDLRGIVVDPDGVPVASALIVLAEWGGSTPRVAGESDSRGRFRLQQAPRSCNIGARAKGFAPSPMRTVMAGTNAKIDVRIQLAGPGGGVRGQVLGPDGRGISNAAVRIGALNLGHSAINLPDGSRGMGPRDATARTDTEGRFELFGLGPGNTPATARADRLAPWVGSVNVVAHMTMPLVIHLEPGVTCEGTVLTASGEPAVSLHVTHSGYDTPTRRGTRTAADGSYRLEGLPAGRVKVQINNRKHGSASHTFQASPGETVRWDVRLSLGLVFTGIVADHEGKPLEKVIIEANARWEKGRSNWFAHAFTDKRGRFRLVDCPEDRLLDLRLRKSWYTALHKVGIDPKTGHIELRLPYEGKPNAKIRGRVLDPDGKPVVNARISPYRQGDGNSRVYSTDAEGWIKIDKLRPGTYTLWVRSGSYPAHRTKFVLTSGATHDVGTVRLIRGGRVLVRVARSTDSKEAFYLMLRDAKNNKMVLSINPRKTPLRSGSVAPGDYLLSVTGPKVIPTSFPCMVRAGEETEIQIRVPIGVARRLKFATPPDAEKVKKMQLTLVGPKDFKLTRTLTRWRPTPFGINLGLAPGAYRLDASTKEGHRATHSFQVPEGGAEKTMTIELK